MGVHVDTRPSGHPHTPHAADNQPQEPLLAHPVEADSGPSAEQLAASTDTSGLAEAATGRRRSGSGSFPVGATSARARPSSLDLLQVGCRARFLSGEQRLVGGGGGERRR